MENGNGVDGHVERETILGSRNNSKVAENGIPGVAEKDHGVEDGAHLETGNPGNMSNEHRDYLIKRHGTADLDPLPTMDPADPLNWPAWKVRVWRNIT